MNITNRTTKCLMVQIYGHIRWALVLLGCDTVSIGSWWWKFWDRLVTPSSRVGRINAFLKVSKQLFLFDAFFTNCISICAGNVYDQQLYQKKKILWHARHNAYENINQPPCQEKLQCPMPTFGRISEYQWHQHLLMSLHYLIQPKNP